MSIYKLTSSTLNNILDTTDAYVPYVWTDKILMVDRKTEGEKYLNTFAKIVTINAVVIKILKFLEVSVRNIRGSEIDGIVELHIFFFLTTGKLIS